MIQVGINENVYFDKATLDPQTLYLGVVFDEISSVKPASAFAALSQADAVDSTGMTINLFPPKLPDKADMTEEKKRNRVVDDLMKTKGILRHIMKQYMKSEDCEFDMWTGTGMTDTNFDQLVMQNNVLAIVHKNMATQFIAKMAPFTGKKEYPMRLLLVRTSKDKHYATFRGKFLEEQPFIEPMEIPKEQSKLAFTTYEIREGLNDGTPVSKDKADVKGASENPAQATNSAPTSAASIFGGGAPLGK